MEGGLTADGMQILPIELLAKTAWQMGLTTGAVVHVFNRWQWAEADFTLGHQTVRLPIDALAVRRQDQYQVIPRRKAYYPPVQRNNAAVTYYSAMGTLVELAVDTATGHVDLLNHHSILECGNQIVPELVSGQIQGGLAMGIGHALHGDWPCFA